MPDKIEGIKPSESSTIGKKVETKKVEIQQNSVFKKFKGDAKNEFVEDTAFLLSVFDKDNDNNITKEEVKAVKDEDYNEQLKDYNNNHKPLILDEGNDMKIKLTREIENAEGKNKDKKPGLLAPMKAALQSKSDIITEGPYFDALKEIIELKNKPKLTEDDKLRLKDFEELRKMYEKRLSPEAIEKVQLDVVDKVYANKKSKDEDDT